jgi:hypothetical protein
MLFNIRFIRTCCSLYTIPHDLRGKHEKRHISDDHLVYWFPPPRNSLRVYFPFPQTTFGAPRGFSSTDPPSRKQHRPEDQQEEASNVVRERW